MAPILIEMIEQHDEHTTSDAENGIRKLWDLEVKNDDVRGAVGRCLNRAREKLATLQAAFAPIQNQTVPERVTLQSGIQDYTSLVETMEDYLARDWTPASGASGAAAYGGAPAAWAPSGASASNFPPRPASSGGGFPKWIIAPIVLVLVGGAFFATKGRALLAGRTTAASASASAPAAVSVAPAKPSAAPATPAAGSTTPPAKPAPTAKGKKK